MPLLQDKNELAKLRSRFPTLTHTTWRPLDQILPHDNVNKYREKMGEIVCATSGDIDRDFYALRCNEKEGMTNMSIPFVDSKGNTNWMFVFEKMKDEFFEHVVSSQDFTPVVSPREGKFEGEWVSRGKVTPLSVTRGTKEDVLKRTSAHVFTIADMEALKKKLRDNDWVDRLRKRPDQAFGMVSALMAEGILKKENDPDSRPNLNRFLENNSKEQNTSKVNDMALMQIERKRNGLGE